MTDDRLSVPDDHGVAGQSLPQVPAAPAKSVATASLYDKVGGDAFFVDLVDAFYERVAADPVLRPLYPDPDLQAANLRLRMFLIQYWGGPTTYSQQRGHPRLRMRHAPFPVGDEQIAAWLTNMRGALDHVVAAPDIDAELWAYFQHAAVFMKNQPS